MRNLHFLESSAEAFLGHLHHYQYSAVSVELIVVFIFQLIGIRMAEMYALHM
jgi:hypothetical protein